MYKFVGIHETKTRRLFSFALVIPLAPTYVERVSAKPGSGYKRYTYHCSHELLGLGAAVGRGPCLLKPPRLGQY